MADRTGLGEAEGSGAAGVASATSSRAASAPAGTDGSHTPTADGHESASGAADAALLEAVLRHLPQGVILAAAPDGRLLAGNEQVARIWRHPFKPSGSIPEYGEWRGFHRDGTPYRPDEWPLARAISGGEAVTDELIAIQRGDGTRGVIQVSATPVREDATGRIVAGVVTFTDVTEQRQLADRTERLHFVNAALAEAVTAEEVADVVLAASRASFRAAGACLALVPEDAAGDGTYGRDGRDGRDGSLLAVLRATGPPPDAPDWAALAADEDSALVRAARFRRPILPENHPVAALPLVVEGRVLGVLALSVPASGTLDEGETEFAQALALQCAQALDRARLYGAEKAARERAERALQAREQFLSAAAHELKTPLTSLQGAAQLAQRRLEREGSLEESFVRQTLDLVVQQAKRLGRLMVALLDVTRLESGTIVLNRRPEDVSALVRRAAETMQDAARQHRLSLSAPDEPHELRAMVDRVRLEQVLFGLVDNAIKYTPAGTRIALSVEPADQEGFLSVTVADDGPGIAPEHRDRIFDRYYRADPTTSLSGMGLGLYLCREIARAHGGDLTAAYPSDGGVCFELRLPLLQEPPSQP